MIYRVKVTDSLLHSDNK